MNISSAISGTVTQDALISAIQTVIDSQRIGTAVSVRIHWQVAEVSLRNAAAFAMEIASAALELDGAGWRRRPASQDGPVLNVLGEDGRGRTALITLCRSESAEFSATVFGNHGVLRLEHAAIDEKSLRMTDSFAEIF